MVVYGSLASLASLWLVQVMLYLALVVHYIAAMCRFRLRFTAGAVSTVSPPSAATLFRAETCRREMRNEVVVT